jgi:hypothetical protein
VVHYRTLYQELLEVGESEPSVVPQRPVSVS